MSRVFRVKTTQTLKYAMISAMNQPVYPTGDQRPPIASLQATADIALITFEDSELKAVCIERRREPLSGSLALPGGFIWHDETSLQAAKRVLAVKAGVSSDIYIEQLYTFDDPQRDSRGRIMSITYLALVPRQQLQIVTSPETEKPTLYPVKHHPALSFDHERILKYGLNRLRSKLLYTNIAYSLLSPRFTFAELQRLYETVLGHSLDKRNFRKKYLSLGLIKPSNETVASGRHRPAQLFYFVDHHLIELSEPMI
jgi:8-oxo-dGTP diphosphatase